MQSDRIDSANYYSFGPYTLNKAGLELLKDGKQVPLTRKRFEVLLLLVENAGQVMLKEEILERIWPDQYIDEANLANNIHAIRRLIEEDPRTPRLIQTIPGRGYKFQGIVDVKAILPVEVSAVKVETEQLPKSRMSTWLIVAVVGLFLAGLTGWFLRRSTVPEKVATPSFPQPLTAYPGTERFPALTPDGKLIAFTWNGDQLENEDIYVRQTIESELVRLTSHPGADQMPTWSPDGHYIAFLRSAEKKGNPRHLMVIPALGGTEREIALVDDGLDWSPDGQYLAISGLNESGGGMGIFLISIDGNVRRRLTSPPPKGGSFDSTPRYSPDGRSIAFLRYKSDAGCDLFLIDLTRGEERQLTIEKKLIKAHSLQWSGDGQRLYFLSNQGGVIQLWQVRLDNGIPEVVPNLPAPMTSYSIAHKSNLFAYVNEQNDTRIEILEKGAEASPCLINSTRSDYGEQFSPDGSQILFCSSRTGFDELWIAQVDCRQVRQLTNFREFGVGSPRWSPDGQQIVFDRRNREESDIYTIRVDGSGLRRVTDSIGSNTLPFWSPDGGTIYFTSNRAIPHTKNQIWKIPAGGGEAVQVTFEGKSGAWEPVASSDGRMLYYNQDNRLWSLDLANGKTAQVKELANLYLNRNWNIGGASIYYHQPHPGAGSLINRLDPATGKISLFMESRFRLTDDFPSLSVSKGEQRTALTTIGIQLSDIMLINNWR